MNYTQNYLKKKERDRNGDEEDNDDNVIIIFIICLFFLKKIHPFQFRMKLPTQLLKKSFLQNTMNIP